jgi:hypothetical protein
MGMLRILSSRGDDCVVWDVPQAAAGDPEALAAVQEAERVFLESRALGATALKVERGQIPARIDVFDPAAEQIVMIPRVIGG